MFWHLRSNLYDDQVIENPSAYTLGTARNVFREHVRKSARLTQIGEESESTIAKGQACKYSDPFLECAILCLHRLADDKRLLLEQYYSEEGDREALGRQEGVSLAGLRTKIYRMKAELRKCYLECMRGSSS